MIKQYILQAWAQLKQQPLISAVTIAGTALSIFLIMLVVMMQQVKVEPFAPESNRDRFLHVKSASIEKKGTSNGSMSVRTFNEIYGKMKTPQAVTAYTFSSLSQPVSLPGQPSTAVNVRETDSQYWIVFDFAFIDGKPYSQADFTAGQPLAVITASVAQSLFGTTQATGKEFLLAHAPYRVCGVVKDVSTLATNAYGQVWIPYTSTNQEENTWNEGLMGFMSCTILAHKRSDFPAIREEANRRMEEYNKTISESGWKFISRNRPYDQEKNALAVASNYEPDLAASHRERFTIFLILLIVPAINLSSMTQSRLRRRVSEIGVRRAFGCTRMELLGQLLSENFIITLLAGILGLLLSFAFAYMGNEVFFAQEYSNTLNPPTVDASILIHASTFGWALLFCFILNLLSSGIPAWKATKMNIVNSLEGKLK